MVKVIRSLVILLISYLLLSQGSVSAELDKTMVGVKKYQKFNYMQTKFVGNVHPFFYVPPDFEYNYSHEIFSRDNHIFSLKIKDIITYEPGFSRIDCEYSKDDISDEPNNCNLDRLTIFSPFLYIDWEYWEEYLEELSYHTNSSTSTVEISNEANVFGYTWDYNWFDPSNSSIFGNQLAKAIYDKRMGNMINFSLNSTDSDRLIENAYAYQLVSSSMDYSFDDIDEDIYFFIGSLIFLIILIYVIFRIVKKKLSSDKLLEAS